MQVQERVSCACKGIRTCNACEGCHEINSSAREKYTHTFDYNVESGEAELFANAESFSFPFPGVLVYNDFLSTFEEKELAALIDGSMWKDSQSGRRKQDYGPKVNFKRKKVKVGSFSGLPCFMKTFIKRLRALSELQDFNPVELCNLEYMPERGSSIDPHFDDDWLWGERLITVNLLSDSKLTMSWPMQNESRPNLGTCPADWNLSNLCVKVPLNRRSLVVLYGPARYKWMHEIERCDISDRRLCCTLRELSYEFLIGPKKSEGQKLLDLANCYDGNVVL